MRPLPAHLAGVVFTHFISHGVLMTHEPSSPAAASPAPALLLWGTHPYISSSPEKKCPKMAVNTALCPRTIHFPPAWDLSGESRVLHKWASNTPVKLFYTHQCPARAMPLLPQWNRAYPVAADHSTTCRTAFLWPLIPVFAGIKHIAFKSQALKAKIHPKNALNHRASVSAFKASEHSQREPGTLLSPLPWCL